MTSHIRVPLRLGLGTPSAGVRCSLTVNAKETVQNLLRNHNGFACDQTSVVGAEETMLIQITMAPQPQGQGCQLTLGGEIKAETPRMPYMEGMASTLLEEFRMTPHIAARLPSTQESSH